MEKSKKGSLVMERLCGSFYVEFHWLCFSDRLCLFDYKYCVPYNLLDFRTGIMKRRKTKINTRQVVVNHIDANIIVKQQRLIDEYERFNEHLMLMLDDDPDRDAIQFSDEILGAHFIVRKLREMLECLHIIKKKDGNTETEKV